VALRGPQGWQSARCSRSGKRVAVSGHVIDRIAPVPPGRAACRLEPRPRPAAGSGLRPPGAKASAVERVGSCKASEDVSASHWLHWGQGLGMGEHLTAMRPIGPPCRGRHGNRQNQGSPDSQSSCSQRASRLPLTPPSTSSRRAPRLHHSGRQRGPDHGPVPALGTSFHIAQSFKVSQAFLAACSHRFQAGPRKRQGDA